MSHHPRPALAASLADEMLGKIPLSDSPNGLFLSGPRRTGKTQFLRFDLKPELEQRGLLVIYADLWAADNRTPLERLLSPIALAVAANQGAIAKFVKKLGIDKLSVPGAFQMDVGKIGKTDGMSVHEVLNTLHLATEKPVVLMVDEAQEALTTDEGQSAMRALKSARDQMKTPTSANLLLVMAGSHRDKLMRLLNSASAPFWGSQVRTLPLLGDDFVQALATQLRSAKPEWGSLRTSPLVQAFEHFGRRPQQFFNALQAAQVEATDGAAFERALLAQAQQQREQARQAFTDVYLALEPIQQAVLQRMLDLGTAYKAFDEKALAFYANHLGKPVGASQVQAALDELRTDQLRLVWKAHRGEYVIYDQDMREWHEFSVNAKLWPPA